MTGFKSYKKIMLKLKMSVLMIVKGLPITVQLNEWKFFVDQKTTLKRYRQSDCIILQPETKIIYILVFYLRCEQECFLKFFDCGVDFLFCHNIVGVLIPIGLITKEPNHWRFFIDRSKNKFPIFTEIGKMKVLKLKGIEIITVKLFHNFMTVQFYIWFPSLAYRTWSIFSFYRCVQITDGAI